MTQVEGPVAPGGGIAARSVTRGILIEEEIRPGQLLELFSEIYTRGFYIIKRPGVLRPQVRAIVTWLKRRAGAEMTIRS